MDLVTFNPFHRFDVEINGEKFSIVKREYMGSQACFCEEDISVGDSGINVVPASVNSIGPHRAFRDLELTNQRTGEKIEFSTLLPHLVLTHKFFEGEGTSFRLSPQTVINFFRLKPGETAAMKLIATPEYLYTSHAGIYRYFYHKFLGLLAESESIGKKLDKIIHHIQRHIDAGWLSCLSPEDHRVLQEEARRIASSVLAGGSDPGEERDQIRESIDILFARLEVKLIEQTGYQPDKYQFEQTESLLART